MSTCKVVMDRGGTSVAASIRGAYQSPSWPRMVVRRCGGGRGMGEQVGDGRLLRSGACV
jgi:hypothetical protein